MKRLKAQRFSFHVTWAFCWRLLDSRSWELLWSVEKKKFHVSILWCNRESLPIVLIDYAVKKKGKTLHWLSLFSSFGLNEAKDFSYSIDVSLHIVRLVFLGMHKTSFPGKWSVPEALNNCECFSSVPLRFHALRATFIVAAMLLRKKRNEQSICQPVLRKIN